MIEYFNEKKQYSKELSLMYSIIQKIYEKNNKILKEGLKIENLNKYTVIAVNDKIYVEKV